MSHSADTPWERMQKLSYYEQLEALFAAIAAVHKRALFDANTLRKLDRMRTTIAAELFNRRDEDPRKEVPSG